jgi:hypothetical protein
LKTATKIIVSALGLLSAVCYANDDGLILNNHSVTPVTASVLVNVNPNLSGVFVPTGQLPAGNVGNKVTLGTFQLKGNDPGKILWRVDGTDDYDYANDSWSIKTASGDSAVKVMSLDTSGGAEFTDSAGNRWQEAPGKNIKIETFGAQNVTPGIYNIAIKAALLIP